MTKERRKAHPMEVKKSSNYYDDIAHGSQLHMVL